MCFHKILHYLNMNVLSLYLLIESNFSVLYFISDDLDFRSTFKRNILAQSFKLSYIPSKFVSSFFEDTAIIIKLLHICVMNFKHEVELFKSILRFRSLGFHILLQSFKAFFIGYHSVIEFVVLVQFQVDF